MNNSYDGYFWLSFLANLCQLESFNLLVRDKTNNEIMNELNKQNSEYLENIKNDIQEIKIMLKEGK